jgi:hypothetical protein
MARAAPARRGMEGCLRLVIVVLIVKSVLFELSKRHALYQHFTDK